jgi:hypothetical protein
MNKNRMGGIRRRASWQRTAKPISIKDAGCKSGGGALKAVELTSGDLLLVANSRLRMSDRSNLSQQQKSAEGIVITRVVKARTVLREEGKESGK